MTEHRFVPTERPDARPPAGSKGRANPAEAHQRTPPPAKASSRSSIISPARPQRHNAPAATRTRSNPARPSMTTPRSHGTPMHRFGQGTNRVDHYRSSAAPRPTSIRSSVVPAERHRAVPAVRTCGPIRSSNPVPSERSTVRSSRTPTSRFVRSCSTSPGVLRSSQPPLSTLGGRRNEPTPADRQTSTRQQCRITPCRKNAVHTSCSENAATSNKDSAPRQPHRHRLKLLSSQLTKARPPDLPVWPRRHKPESPSAIFRSKALRRLDSKSLPSFIASPIRAGVPNRSFIQPSA